LAYIFNQQYKINVTGGIFWLSLNFWTTLEYDQKGCPILSVPIDGLGRASRREAIRKKQLELRLAGMQKQSEASGTNMEDLLVALQRIDHLVEADPDRSREEITIFSHLLRTGYMRP
jgi:hypothetical protein